MTSWIGEAQEGRIYIHVDVDVGVDVCVYMCFSLSRLVVRQEPTRLCKAIILQLKIN